MTFFSHSNGKHRAKVTARVRVTLVIAPVTSVSHPPAAPAERGSRRRGLVCAAPDSQLMISAPISRPCPLKPTELPATLARRFVDDMHLYIEPNASNADTWSDQNSAFRGRSRSGKQRGRT